MASYKDFIHKLKVRSTRLVKHSNRITGHGTVQVLLKVYTGDFECTPVSLSLKLSDLLIDFVFFFLPRDDCIVAAICGVGLQTLRLAEDY